jgi:PmbA protein
LLGKAGPVDASLDELTAALLQAARRAGAGAADAMAAAESSVAIDVRGGRLEKAERSESVELGLRVLVGCRQASVAASDLRPATLAAMAERAVAMAREAPEDPSLGLADPGELAHGWNLAALDLVDPSPEPPPSALEAAARRAEAAAMAVPGVRQIDPAAAWHATTRVHLAATNGFAGSLARTSSGLSCIAITGEGTAMERDWCSEGRAHAADLPDPEWVGRRAGERAVARAGARKPPTGSFPVLFDERVAGSLIGHLLAAVNGTAIVRGASWLRDALGARVLSPGIDLWEEPHRPRIGGSRPFDAEGLPTARRAIVRDGVLQGWTLDLSTARRLGMRSTASASRGPGSAPAPAAGNVTLTQGGEDRAALMRAMGRGLLVTSMLGASVNPTTGDYSRGAAGFWVEGGEIAWPVNECTIAGNLRPMLAGLRPANDARMHLSHVVPSLLVEGLTIAGG